MSPTRTTRRKTPGFQGVRVEGCVASSTPALGRVRRCLATTRQQVCVRVVSTLLVSGLLLARRRRRPKTTLFVPSLTAGEWVREVKMGAYHCPGCQTNWPTMTEFKTCPECVNDRLCAHFVTTDPIVFDEAIRRLRFAQFERFYEQREKDQAESFAREMVERMASIEDS